WRFASYHLNQPFLLLYQYVNPKVSAIRHWYENRESTLRGVTISAIPMGVDALLQPYRIIAI
ncbi:MAG: phage gp6-like head-tail connector protein, partial [Chromatiales bacterium]